jgi:hypothetical protein
MLSNAYTEVPARSVTGHYGIIFEGTIKQLKKGRDSPIDSYLRLYCADGDTFARYGTSNGVLPAGWVSFAAGWQYR